ncbi:MAG TPA: hemolysin family protein [Dermatophilaceae bacterium]|nr:hemolysin family protein [Dermatophilaceae bacterium]
MSHAAALWLSAFLLAANAFFVGAEFSVMAARRSQLEPMAAAGSRRAQICLDALEQVASLLAMAQLGITICSVGLGAVAEATLEEMISPLLDSAGLPDSLSHPIALAVALLLIAYLHVVLGEMVPKNIAIAGPDRAALLLAPPLLFITRALRPLIRLMEGIAKGIVRRLGVEPQDELSSAFTAQEVADIVSESHREGLLEKDQVGLASRALEFSDRVAGDVAVPLSSLVTLSLTSTPDDLERLVARRGFSRYPVRDAAGDLVGYMHLKDVLGADERSRSQPFPASAIRRLASVAAGDEVEDVLTAMQRTGAHLARVEADDGTVLGVVFLEDVLEELVGEVTDATQRR